MTLAALAFAAGAAALQWQPALPGAGWALALVPLALLAWRRPKTVCLPAFAFGFFWAALLAGQRMADWLPLELEGRDLEVTGVVASLPASGERGVRFEFEVEASAEARMPQKIQLS